MGFSDDWESGTVEIILHPFEDESDEALKLFYSSSEIPKDNTHVRVYNDGITFISAKCTKQDIERLKKLNPLRAVHPIGHIDISPIRSGLGGGAPTITPSQKKSAIKVGVFDGGCDDSNPLLYGYAHENDCVTEDAILKLVEHGTGVCGTVLHGNLAGKSEPDVLPIPSVSVESFRVLPLQNHSDFELYESIDAIEKAVKKHQEIKLYNISFGPVGAIIDDSISRFTYVLDKLTSDTDEGEVTPLFCVAAGNDGDLQYPLNRVQSPSDLVNGLGIGSYTFDNNGNKTRASYSCIGAGREGAKIKPDVLEFGGSIDHPFIVVGINPGTLSATAGTSFSSPLVVHRIGNLMAKSENIVPHLGRTLIIHNANLDENLSQLEQGYGFCSDEMDDILLCENNKVTILFAGTLEPTQTVRLPIFAPKINSVKGNVTISWTITTIVDPCINDPDAYTSNCIVDVFMPHAMTFKYFKKGQGGKKINLLKPDAIVKAKELQDQGYNQSEFPASHPSKKYWDESDLRNSDFKWDTVVHKWVRMRGSSLLNPTLSLQTIGRTDLETNKIKYFAAITIDAPNYIGSLYDETLQQYQNLTPIEIRNVNRIMVEL